MTVKGGWTLSRQTWISASIILVAAAAISKGLGFGREILIANYFGATGSVDAFAVAYSVPLFVAGGIGFTLSTAIVPGYHRIRASEGPQRAARFLCSAAFASVMCSVILLAPLWIAPLSVMKLVAPALPDATLRLAADLMGWLSLYVLVSNGVYVLTAVFHALNHFKVPAYGDIAFNLATIVILVGYSLPLGIYSLVLGNLVGSLLCLTILAGTLLKFVPCRPTLPISGDDLRGLLPLTLPILGILCLFTNRGTGCELFRRNIERRKCRGPQLRQDDDHSHRHARHHECVARDLPDLIDAVVQSTKRRGTSHCDRTREAPYFPVYSPEHHADAESA